LGCAEAVPARAATNPSAATGKRCILMWIAPYHGFRFCEEPVPSDRYEETRQVADALAIPIAGGEEEASLRQFRFMIEHQLPQVVQPDLFYAPSRAA
jgi:L-alanine-DL-glutamate epimerase-like enolase superfamily enzyme